MGQQATQKITLWAQVQCVRREIAMRNRVYRRRVQEGRMTQAAADRELAEMQAVYETLQRLEHDEAHQSTLDLGDGAPMTEG
jgi:hypothetical protein